MILRTDEIDAVIFDLDGTLMDSMWLWRAIDVEFLGRFGITLPDNLQMEIEGMSFSETAVYFQRRFNLPMDPDEIKSCWTEMAMDKYSHQVPPKKGVKEFVEKLKVRGIPLAIASSNSRQLIDAVLKNNGMDDCFDTVVISCEVAHGKPAPDVFLLAAQRLHVKPGRCLVFEDIVPGILGGKRAGMKVCAVEDAHSLQTAGEKRELADEYISDYDEIELE